MKTTITQTGDFQREVQVEPVDAVPGSYLLQFNSQLASARNPQEWQRNFGLVLQRQELQTLRDAINAVL